MSGLTTVPTDERFTAALCAEVEAILASKAGSLTKWTKIAKLFKADGIAAIRTGVKPEHVIVHPLNRGGAWPEQLRGAPAHRNHQRNRRR